LIIIIWILLAVSNFALTAFLFEFAGGQWAEPICLIVLNGWLLCAAYMDGKSHRIPNRWILCGLMAVVFAMILEDLSGNRNVGGIADNVVGGFLGGGILLTGALICRGGIGMGDVKLFFVLGCFVGTERVFFVLLVTLFLALAVWYIGKSYMVSVLSFFIIII
jgi:Flp pilus assembly protein protease CpaA